jgi:hypothetical protein
VGFKKIILLISAIFICFQIFYYFLVPFKRLDTIPIGIESILIFVFIIYYFFEQFKISKDELIYLNYFFWVAIGIMIYLGTTFFFNILANHLDKQIRAYWFLSYSGDILKNCLFVVGILVYLKKGVRLPEKNSKSVPYLDMI